MAATRRAAKAWRAWLRMRATSPDSRACSSAALALDDKGFFFRLRLRAPFARGQSLQRLGDGRDVLGRISATTAGNVDEARAREIAQVTGHVVWAQIESGLRERIRQTGVRVTGDRGIRLLREFSQKWIHQVGTERAIETHRQGPHM